jgi:hypothetical protein
MFAGGALKIQAILPALLISFGGCGEKPLQQEALGDKIKRDCVSLIDTVRATEKEPTVRTATLAAELKKRGVTVPTSPEYPTFSDYPNNPARSAAEHEANRKAQVDALRAYDRGGGGAYGAALRQYEANQEASHHAWEELKSRPEYSDAWNAARAIERDEATRKCITERAKREGVE